MSEPTANGNGDQLSRLLADESQEDRDRLETVWQAAGPAGEESFPDPKRIGEVRAALDEVLNRPGIYAVPARPASPRRPFRRFAFTAAAVILIAAAAIAFRVRTHVFEAPRTAVAVVELPDGSTADLNNGTRLTFRHTLSGDRLVTLQGEAFFDVTTTDDVFEITTFNGRIDVLGTRFNVRAWASGVEQATRVTLESGRLQLAHRDHPRAAVVLSPGETRSILSERAQPSEAETEPSTAAMAWREGDLIFRDTRLVVALEDVERRFDIQIRLSADEYRDRRVNVAFRAPGDPEAVLRDMALAFGLKYRPTSTGFELYPGEE